VLGAVVVAATAVCVLRARGRARPETVLLVAAALATPVGVVLYSLVVDDLYAARNLWASLPATAVLAGAALTRLPDRRVALAASLVAVAAMAVGTVRTLAPDVHRPDYEAAGRAVRAAATAPGKVGIAELALAPTTPPLRTALAVQLPPRLAVVQSDLAGPCVWAAGTRLLAVTAAVPGPPPLPPAPAGTRLVARRVYQGAPPLQLLTYDVPASAATPACRAKLARPGVTVRGLR
jgi:hypothetical protein